MMVYLPEVDLLLEMERITQFKNKYKPEVMKRLLTLLIVILSFASADAQKYWNLQNAHPDSVPTPASGRLIFHLYDNAVYLKNSDGNSSKAVQLPDDADSVQVTETYKLNIGSPDDTSGKLNVNGDITGGDLSVGSINFTGNLVIPYSAPYIWKAFGNELAAVDTGDIRTIRIDSCVKNQGYNGAKWVTIDSFCYSIGFTPSVFNNLYWAEFDGSDDYATAGAQDSLEFQPDDAFAFSAIIRDSYLGGGISAGAIVGNWNSGDGYILSVVSNSSLPVLQFLFGTTNSNRIIVQSETMPRYSVKNIVVSYDGSGNAAGVKMYLNGVELSTSIVDDDIGATVVYSSDLNVGGATASQYFDGFIDELAIYKDTLNASEVLSIYNNMDGYDLSGVGGLYSWWRMGDGDNYPSLYDTINSIDLTMTSMTSGDIVLVPDYSPKKITIIAGQSNAVGQALLNSLPVDIENFTAAYIWSGSLFDAIESGVNLNANASNAHGPELPFAYKYNQAFDDGADTCYILKQAQNSTDLATDWAAGTGVRYLLLESALSKAITAMPEYRFSSVSDTVNFFWFQGESDAQDSTKASNYANNWIAFIDSFESAFPNNVFEWVDMGLPPDLNTKSTFDWTDTVNVKKAEVAALKGNVNLIANTSAFTTKSDTTHYNSNGYQVIADSMIQYVTKQQTE